jgi:hypothetical protein
MLHIRKVGSDIWHSGEITPPPLVFGTPDYDPYEEEERKRIAEEVKRAQNYTEEELNAPGQRASGRSMSLNLMEYIDFPFEEGIYEIYLSFSGLESNRVKVEIIFEE